MTIPVSSIVNVSITLGATFPSRKGFGILNCVTAETGVIGFAERIRSYSDAAGVAQDWPSNSEVVTLANTYFSQQPKPTEFRVSVRAAAATNAELRGGGIADTAENLALFTPITDGSFTISIDGASEDISGLDFSSATDLSDVAGVVQTALQAVATGGFTAATCTHDGSRFTVLSGTTGASSTISFATVTSPAVGTDVSGLLLLTQAEATKSDGLDPETITEALDAIEAASSDWYGLVFTKEVRENVQINGEDAVLAAAAWVQARVKTFFNTTNDLDAKDPVSTGDIGYLLNASNYTRTMTTFSSDPDAYPSASAAGRAFTVDFNQPDSTITLKFKQLPGIPVENLSSSEKAALDGKRINAFFKVGDSDIFAESYMAGDFFFDEIHGVDWLTDAIQTEVFGYLLSRGTKVPYTNKGVAALQQQVTRVLDQSVSNGLVGPGETVDGVFLGNGYVINTVPVEDVSPSDKQNRQYNGLSFIALGAGAIHGVQIQATFER